MTDRPWDPNEEYVSRTNVASLRERHGLADLVPADAEELATIWDAIVTDAGIRWEEPYDTVVDLADGPAFADWFVGGRLNAVTTVLDPWLEREPDRTVYVWEDERGGELTMSYRELAALTDRIAAGLRDHGVGRGDRLGIVFPLHPHAMATALACLSRGAVVVPIFPGYGAGAIAHRLRDCGADLLVTADGFARNGSPIDLREKVNETLAAGAPVTDVVVHEHVGTDGAIDGATEHAWEAFLADDPGTVERAVVDADHPAVIAYSSGTTGAPKGTTHTHASLLAMGLKEAKYHFDLEADDTFLWVTDFGWIIVPIWLLCGGPALGARTVLLEGGPMHPSETRVLQAIEDHGVTTFGISPSGARQLRSAVDTPRSRFDLETLSVLGSTGEPWDEETWTWYFEAVGGEAAPVINASGGTELAGAILSPTPADPLTPGTLYGPAPGVAANVYDRSGEPADQGYLVVELPMPGMTNGLTAGDERYLEEYWSDFEGVWNQNDWVERDDDDFWYITGRADDTMNVGGRRVTAPAIEEAILGLEAVADAVVVPVPDDRRGEVPVAFVVAAPDATAAALPAAVTEQVATALGAPFRPATVHVVPDIPTTQTGKRPRGVVERVYVDGEAPSTETLQNGGVLDRYPRLEDQ